MVQSTERTGGCNHQTTAPVMSCAAAISVQMHKVEARDLWGWVLQAELRFLDQRHVHSVTLQDIVCGPGNLSVNTKGVIQAKIARFSYLCHRFSKTANS